jgi:hypothetical protein
VTIAPRDAGLTANHPEDGDRVAKADASPASRTAHPAKPPWPHGKASTAPISVASGSHTVSPTPDRRHHWGSRRTHRPHPVHVREGPGEPPRGVLFRTSPALCAGGTPRRHCVQAAHRGGTVCRRHTADGWWVAARRQGLGWPGPQRGAGWAHRACDLRRELQGRRREDDADGQHRRADRRLGQTGPAHRPRSPGKPHLLLPAPRAVAVRTGRPPDDQALVRGVADGIRRAAAGAAAHLSLGAEHPHRRGRRHPRSGLLAPLDLAASHLSIWPPRTSRSATSR